MHENGSMKRGLMGNTAKIKLLHKVMVMCTLDKEPDGVVQTVNCGSAQQF